MKHRDDKIARAAHIKARTEGTSNEISLSVLDAAKYAVDNKRSDFRLRDVFARRPSRHENSSDVSRETSEEAKREKKRLRRAEREQSRRSASFKTTQETGRSGTNSARHVRSKQSTISEKRVSLEEEIARRKARRRLGRVAALSIVAVASMTIIAVGVWAWHVDTTEQQGYEAKLMESLELVSQADDTILEIDAIVDDPFSDESILAKASAIDDVPNMLVLLEQADEKARDASDGLNDPTVKSVANQAVISIAARQEMMQEATELVRASQQADDAAKQCESIWESVLEADNVTHEASKLVEADDPAASKEKTQQANSAFEDALAQLQAFQSAHNEVGLSPAVAYIEKRIEAAEYAIAADDALLDRNKEEALAQNDLYNKAETEAAALAEKLPSNMSKLFHDAYSETYSTLVKSYTAKRAEAGTSDAVIRDYLGAQGK